MRKRLLWLGGLTVLIGLAVGFALAKRSDAARRRACPLQAESAATSEDPAPPTSRLVLSNVPKLALDLDKDKAAPPSPLPQPVRSGSVQPAPSGTATSPPANVERVEAVPSNVQSRTLTPEQLNAVRRLAKQVRQLRQDSQATSTVQSGQ